MDVSYELCGLGLLQRRCSVLFINDIVAKWLQRGRLALFGRSHKLNIVALLAAPQVEVQRERALMGGKLHLILELRMGGGNSL